MGHYSTGYNAGHSSRPSHTVGGHSAGGHASGGGGAHSSAPSHSSLGGGGGGGAHSSGGGGGSTTTPDTGGGSVDTGGGSAVDSGSTPTISERIQSGIAFRGAPGTALDTGTDVVYGGTQGHSFGGSQSSGTGASRVQTYVGGTKTSDTDRVQVSSGSWVTPTDATATYKGGAIEYATLVAKDVKEDTDIERIKQLESSAKKYAEAEYKGKQDRKLSDIQAKNLVKKIRTKAAEEGGFDFTPFAPKSRVQTKEVEFTSLLAPGKEAQIISEPKAEAIEMFSPASEQVAEETFGLGITGMATTTLSTKDKSKLTYDARRIADLNARINFERSKMAFARDEQALKDLKVEKEKLETSLKTKHPGKDYDKLITDIDGPMIGMATTDISRIESKMSGAGIAAKIGIGEKPSPITGSTVLFPPFITSLLGDKDKIPTSYGLDKLKVETKVPKEGDADFMGPVQPEGYTTKQEFIDSLTERQEYFKKPAHHRRLDEVQADADKVAEINVKINALKNKESYFQVGTGIGMGLPMSTMDDDRQMSSMYSKGTSNEKIKLMQERDVLVKEFKDKYPEADYYKTIIDFDTPTYGYGATSKETAEKQVKDAMQKTWVGHQYEKEYLRKMEGTPEQIKGYDEADSFNLIIDLKAYEKRSKAGKVTDEERALMKSRLGAEVDGTYRVELPEGLTKGAHSVNRFTKEDRMQTLSEYSEFGTFDGAEVKFVSPLNVEDLGKGIQTVEEEKRIPILQPFLRIGKENYETDLLNKKSSILESIEKEELSRIDKQLGPLQTNIEKDMDTGEDIQKEYRNIQTVKYGTAGRVKLYEKTIKDLEEKYKETQNEDIKKQIDASKRELEIAKQDNLDRFTGFGPYYEGENRIAKFNEELDDYDKKLKEHDKNPTEQSYIELKRERDRLITEEEGINTFITQIDDLTKQEDEKAKEIKNLNTDILSNFSKYEKLHKSKSENLDKLQAVFGTREETGKLSPLGDKLYRTGIKGEKERLLEEISYKNVVKQYGEDQLGKAGEHTILSPGWLGHAVPGFVLPVASDFFTKASNFGSKVIGKGQEAVGTMIEGDISKGTSDLFKAPVTAMYGSALDRKDSSQAEGWWEKTKIEAGNVDWDAVEGGINTVLVGGGFLKGLATKTIGGAGTKVVGKEVAKKGVLHSLKVFGKGVGLGALTGIVVVPPTIGALKGEQDLNEMTFNIGKNIARLGFLAAASKGATQMGVVAKKGIVMKQIDKGIQNQLSKIKLDVKVGGKEIAGKGDIVTGHIKTYETLRKPMIIKTSVGKIKVELVPGRGTLTHNEVGQMIKHTGGQDIIGQGKGLIQGQATVKMTLPNGAIMYKDVGSFNIGLNKVINAKVGGRDFTFIEYGKGVGHKGKEYIMFRTGSEGRGLVSDPKTSFVNAGKQNLKTKDILDISRNAQKESSFLINKQQYDRFMSESYSQFKPVQTSGELQQGQDLLVNQFKSMAPDGIVYSSDKVTIIATAPLKASGQKVVIMGGKSYLQLKDGSMVDFSLQQPTASFFGKGTTTYSGVGEKGKYLSDLSKGYTSGVDKGTGTFQYFTEYYSPSGLAGNTGILKLASASKTGGGGLGNFRGTDFTGSGGRIISDKIITETGKGAKNVKSVIDYGQTARGVRDAAVQIPPGSQLTGAYQNLLGFGSADIGRAGASLIGTPSGFNMGAILPALGSSEISDQFSRTTSSPVSEFASRVTPVGGLATAFGESAFGSLSVASGLSSPRGVPISIEGTDTGTGGEVLPGVGTGTGTISTPAIPGFGGIGGLGIITGITGLGIGAFGLPPFPTLGRGRGQGGQRGIRSWVIENPVRNLYREFKEKQFLKQLQPETPHQRAKERVTTMFGAVKGLDAQKATRVTLGQPTGSKIMMGLGKTTFTQPKQMMSKEVVKTTQTSKPLFAPMKPQRALPTMKPMMAKKTPVSRSQMVSQTKKREAIMRKAMASPKKKKTTSKKRNRRVRL